MIVGDVGHRQPGARCGHRVHAPFHLGVSRFRTDDVHDAGYGRDNGLDLCGQAFEHSGVVAEDLHLDGGGRAFEVAQHVLQQLHEFDVEPGRLVMELVAQGVDDLVCRSLARGSGHEAHQHDVSTTA